jgi:predicted metalloprotease
MPDWLRSGRALRLFALLVTALVAGACFVGTAGGDGDAGSGRGSQSGNQPDPGQTPGEQEDGTMTAEEFQNDLDGAVTIAEQFWEGQFQGAGERFQPVREIIPYTRDGEIDCGGEPVPRNNAVYCPAGDFIAYDVNFAVNAFRQVGDAFIYYLLGHEYAHAIQQRLGIQSRFTIDHELHADCMAGAYISGSIKAGSLKLDDGDLDEFQQGLLAVGDDPDIPWFTPGAHGTAEQRTQSFFNGYERGLSACDL